MKAAVMLNTQNQTAPAPLHRCNIIVDSNTHRPDLFAAQLPETGDTALVSEAMLPQIRAVATLIAAMRHSFDTTSPNVFTEEADWFAARIIVLGVRRFHLDITMLPILNLANQRAQAFAAALKLPFVPAQMRMSLHAGRPANLLIVETEHHLASAGNIVADSLALAARLPKIFG
ncbi:MULTISPECIES: hypothetical protein [unclassified Neisseria]|uniref:hypothetical protein n=1 Tax=unclassified Neisseria TaxID=2623750 RepID=UPI002665D257|nr:MULTISPECIES: hypothetical protein [unclassified Neisseria]MDO1510930.1 hypothetical protein [Neisseria sp. MVDL19-042950]MDO1516847.1 hypothetical protein [Neisseria sp. MVDL18-041461]MDO1563941.1 hypothetical protein [Neisseria sp. MVDL20-010259]